MSKKEIQAILNNPAEFDKIAKQGYEEVDTNKSGLIDFEEIGAILKNFAKLNGLPAPSKADIEGVFKKLDKDANGKIDFPEFKVFFKTYLESQ